MHPSTAKITNKVIADLLTSRILKVKLPNKNCDILRKIMRSKALKKTP